MRWGRSPFLARRVHCWRCIKSRSSCPQNMQRTTYIATVFKVLNNFSMLSCSKEYTHPGRELCYAIYEPMPYLQRCDTSMLKSKQFQKRITQMPTQIDSSSQQIRSKLKQRLGSLAWRLVRWALYLSLITVIATVMTLGIAALTIIPAAVPIVMILLIMSGLLFMIRLTI